MRGICSDFRKYDYISLRKFIELYGISSRIGSTRLMTSGIFTVENVVDQDPELMCAVVSLNTYYKDK